MSAAKQIEPGATNKSPEMNIERNVHQMKGASLMRRVYEASTREIDNLIDELRGLREKLETDRGHLESDIVEYADLSQQVMQLTAIISDSVENLPRAPRISQWRARIRAVS